MTKLCIAALLAVPLSVGAAGAEDYDALLNPPPRCGTHTPATVWRCQVREIFAEVVQLASEPAARLLTTTTPTTCRLETLDEVPGETVWLTGYCGPRGAQESIWAASRISYSGACIVRQVYPIDITLTPEQIFVRTKPLPHGFMSASRLKLSLRQVNGAAGEETIIEVDCDRQ